MKILKYIAVLATAMLACATYAADDSSVDPMKVTVNNENGALTVNISFDVKDPTVSCSDALKEVLTKALASVGAESLNGKAISSAMMAIKSALADKNAPAKGSIVVAFQIMNKVQGADNIAQVKTSVSVAGESYVANTETRYNPETQVARTEGNVTVKGQDGKEVSMPVILSVDANDVVKGSVGDTAVVDSVSGQVVPNTLVVPTSLQESATQGTNNLPDNTIVTSAEN